MSLDVDRTDNCPRAAACACGSSAGLAIATIATDVGVFCMTICGGCVTANRLPEIESWSAAIALVWAHCEHLGIDVDQMAAALKAS